MRTTTIPSRAVARATAWDRGGLVAVLAAAFADDPVFAWIEPDPAARHAVLPELFDAFVTAYARHDVTDLVRIDGTVAGAALWAPPGVEPIHPDDAGALDEALAWMAPAAVARTAACMEAFGAAHPEEPAWYLNFLGSAPAHQGRGAGSALLRAVLDGCDQRGEPAYLEATSERNRALYERHGFRLRAKIPLPDGPTVFAMWREPIMPPHSPWPRREGS